MTRPRPKTWHGSDTGHAGQPTRPTKARRLRGTLAALALVLLAVTIAGRWYTHTPPQCDRLAGPGVWAGVSDELVRQRAQAYATCLGERRERAR